MRPISRELFNRDAAWPDSACPVWAGSNRTVWRPVRLPGADHGYFPPVGSWDASVLSTAGTPSPRDALNSFGQLAVDRWVGPAVARRVEPEPFVNALDRCWCAHYVGRIHRAFDRLDWLSPTAIEQCHGCADSFTWIGEGGNQGGDGVRCVLAGKRLDVERRFRPTTRVTGPTWRPWAADDLLVHHGADPMLF